MYNYNFEKEKKKNQKPQLWCCINYWNVYKIKKKKLVNGEPHALSTNKNEVEATSLTETNEIYHCSVQGLPKRDFYHKWHKRSAATEFVSSFSSKIYHTLQTRQDFNESACVPITEHANPLQCTRTVVSFSRANRRLLTNSYSWWKLKAKCSQRTMK